MNKLNKNYWANILLLLLLTVICCTSVIAQSEFDTKSGNSFTLSVKSEYGNTDNFLYDDHHEQNTSYLLLSPTVHMQAQFERQLIQIYINSEHQKYQEFAKDDHSNFTISPHYQYKLADNKAFFVSSSFMSFYEERGTGLSLGEGDSISKGDEAELSEISIGYLYGSKDSVAKFKMELGRSDNQYQTRRNVTAILDKENYFADLSFDYLISGQSYLASSFRYENLQSQNNAILDKKKLTGLVGVKWQATNLSQFSFLLGYQQIKFDQSTFEDDDAFKWRLNLDWHPIESTKLSFNSTRDFSEANRLSNSYRVIDDYNMKITTAFTDYLNVVGTLGLKKENIIFQQREDNEDFAFVDLKLNYQRNEWLAFYINYVYNDLKASDPSYDYQRNSLSIGFNVSI